MKERGRENKDALRYVLSDYSNSGFQEDADQRDLIILPGYDGCDWLNNDMDKNDMIK